MLLNGGDFLGIDIFAGAGGMSLGAEMAGIDVVIAIEKDPHAAATYKFNHPNTKMIVENIENIQQIYIPESNKKVILFGGPPCQGFSTSNQRTRNIENNSNWLYKEFIRITKIIMPDWIVFENVRGFVETEKGLFSNYLIKDFEELGFTCTWSILCASDFGVPQIRSRFFLVGSRHGIKIEMPNPLKINPITVRQAIEDLPSLQNGANQDYCVYPKMALNHYSKSMRNGDKGCRGHLVTNNSPWIIDRYKFIPQGGNWENIPYELISNYKDINRCHTGIYRRLREDMPSVVIGNYRKNMLIHPWENRGLSVREAARLQSFPDWYNYEGSIGFQQQQVGDAVPPILAKKIFLTISNKETY